MESSAVRRQLHTCLPRVLVELVLEYCQKLVGTVVACWDAHQPDTKPREARLVPHENGSLTLTLDGRLRTWSSSRHKGDNARGPRLETTAEGGCHWLGEILWTKRGVSRHVAGRWQPLQRLGGVWEEESVRSKSTSCRLDAHRQLLISDEGQLTLLDWRTARLTSLRRCEMPAKPRAVFALDGDVVLLCGKGPPGTYLLCVWDLRLGTQELAYVPGCGALRHLVKPRFSYRAPFLVGHDHAEGQLMIWHVTREAGAWRLREHCIGYVLCADGRLWFTRNGDGRNRVRLTSVERFGDATSLLLTFQDENDSAGVAVLENFCDVTFCRSWCVSAAAVLPQELVALLTTTGAVCVLK